MMERLVEKYVGLEAPRWLQEGVHRCYSGYRAVRDILRIRPAQFRRFLATSQWLPLEQLERYQLKKLQYLVSYAYRNVPYYQDLFRKHSVTSDSFSSLRDLRKIPVLTRQEVIDNFDKLLSRAIDKKYLRVKPTSGSTGMPLKLYQDIREEYIHNAFYHRAASAAGARLYHRCIFLKARTFMGENTGTLCIYEPQMNRLLLNPLLNESGTWHEKIQLIKSFKPVNIVSTPGVLYDMACYAYEHNIHDVRFKYFLSYFDTLLPHQRTFIEKQFQCRAFSYYSCRERTVSAFECTHRDGMHLDMERGILEVVDSGNEVLPPGQSGRLITTGLYNFAFPLIRYDLGDTGTISSISCACGRGLRFLQSLDGRSSELIRCGNKILASDALTVIMLDFWNIKQYQAVQERENEVILKIVKRDAFCAEDAAGIRRAFRHTMGEKLTVRIEIVDRIPYTSMGKFPLIVSTLERSTVVPGRRESVVP